MSLVKLLDGRAVVVTGAGAGLGRAYAMDVAAHGASVIVNDLSDMRAEAVAAEIRAAGFNAQACAGSVASWEDAQRVVDACTKHFGRLDGLVNNAGVIRVEEPWLADEAGIRAVIETNLMGAVFMGVHALRTMVRQGFGSIVNNTSSAQLGLMRMGVYGATKGGLASLTYSWSIDAAPHGVRVNAYSPVAATAMVDLSPMQHAALPSPEDNAPVVTYLLSDRASEVTGQVIQRRGDALVVMSHPDLTEHAAHPGTWDVEAVGRELDLVLRTGAQPVGDPRARAAV